MVTTRSRGEGKQNATTEGRTTRTRSVSAAMMKEKEKTPIKKSGSAIKKAVSPQKKSPIKLVFTASPGRSTYKSRTKTTKRENEMDVDAITSRMDKCVLEVESPSLSQDSAISMCENLSKSSSSLDSRREEMTPSPSECMRPSTSSFPSKIEPLPRREKQFNELISLVDGSIEKKEPLFVYISGRPGTGKSATIQLVLKQLQLPPRKIKTCIVNCTSVSRGEDLCAAIMKNIEKPCPASSAISKFTAFVTSLRKPFLLVLDEADFVNEHALSTVFTMPTQVSAHLIVIGIANKIDLTERGALKKTKLKIEPIRMVFPRYSKEEIAVILNYKQKDTEEGKKMTASGITLCAAKVSAVTGDIREAMSVMRLGHKRIEEEDEMEVEIKTNENVSCTPVAPRLPGRVTDLRKIVDVIQNVQNSPLSRIRLQDQPKVLLAVCVKLSSNKKKVLTRSTLFNEYRKASAHKDAKWQMAEGEDLNEAFEMLVSLNFISQQKGLIMMQVSSDVARKAIFDNEIIEAIDHIL